MIEKLKNEADRVPEQDADVPCRVYKGTSLPDLRKRTREIKGAQIIESSRLKSLEISARNSYHQLLRARTKFDGENPAAAENSEKQNHLIVENLIAKIERLLDDLLSLNEFLKTLNDDNKEKKLSNSERESLTIAVKLLKNSLAATLNDIARVTFESPLNLNHLIESAKRIMAPLLAGAALAGLICSDASPEVRLGTVIVASQKSEKESGPDDLSRDKKNNTEPLSGNGSYAISEKPFKSKPGGIFQPNIESLGSAGEFPSGKPMAEISFARSSQISDPLWITDTMVQTGDSFVSTAPTITAESKQVQATVKLKPFDVANEETIALPYPLGYGVANVRTEPSAIFSVDNNSRTVKFGVGKNNLVISYDVIKVGENIAAPSQMRAPSFIDSEREKTLELLKKTAPSKLQKALNRYLENFTYITSSQLQSLIDAMPGTFEEKVALLKVGDCDQLSCHLSALLNQAGKNSFVVTGYLQNGNSIDSARPHAKLALANEANKSSLFEVTAATRNKYVNVAFNNLDLEYLSGLIEKMNQNTDPAFRRMQLVDFRAELQTILSKSEYQKFVPHNTFQDAAKDQLNMLERFSGLMNNLDAQADTNPKKILFYFGMIVGEIILIAATIAALIASGKKAEKTIRQDFFKGILELFDKIKKPPEFKDDPGQPSEEKKFLSDEINQIYQEKPELEKITPKAARLADKIEAQKDFVKLIAVAELFVARPWVGLGIIPAALGRLRWNHVIDSLAADGMTVDKIFSGAKTALASSTVLKEMERKMPEVVDEILKAGLKMAAQHDKNGENTNLAGSEKEFTKRLGLKIDEKGRRNSRRSSGKKNFDFLDYVPYQPGMDTNLIDWNVYARTDQLYVKRFADETTRTRTVEKFDILIDAAAASQTDLKTITALLLAASKAKDAPITIGNIHFASFGEITETINESSTGKITGPDRMQSIRYLINKCYRAKLQSIMSCLDKKRVTGSGYRIIRLGYNLTTKTILNRDQKRQLITFGTEAGNQVSNEIPMAI